MTDSDLAVLPPGHRARPAAAWAVWLSVASAVAFTGFAYVTTQVKAVRAGSPWQDDPYDGVVSFTELLVPALAVLIVVRVLLVRWREPQPVFRIAQLVRAALVSTLLIAATVAADWLAVAMRADRRLWNDATPWLIAALVPLTVAVAAALPLLRQASRRLPPRDRRCQGDWLDDLSALIDVSAARLPHAVRRPAARLSQGGAIEFIRGHIVAFAAAASLAAGLLAAIAGALAEHRTSPLLLLTLTFIGAGGFFAFSMVCNTALQIAVPRNAGGTRPEARAKVYRSARIAATAGSMAMPTSAVLRDGIWAALGRDGEVGTVAQLAILTFTSALLTVVLVFGASLCLTGLTTRRPN